MRNFDAYIWGLKQELRSLALEGTISGIKRNGTKSWKYFQGMRELAPLYGGVGRALGFKEYYSGYEESLLDPKYLIPLDSVMQ